MSADTRYLLGHWTPFLVCIVALIVGFAWTAAQEKAIRDNAHHYDSLVTTLRAAAAQQCAFDRAHYRGSAPDFCQEYQPQ